MKSSFTTFWVNVWNWILSSELRQIYSFESKLLRQSANRHQPIPHNCPRNPRTELRIDLQDDGADSVPSVTVTRAPGALLVAPWPLPGHKRGDLQPHAEIRTLSVENKDAGQPASFFPSFRLFVDLLESQITPSCWDSAHNGLFLLKSTKS